jgi:NAD(P)-dependent dehydrogenase (short-subunit alcohol dehydrogenase family)
MTLPFDATSTAADVLAGIDLRGRRFLVTGGASGIGLATATALRDAGADVTATTRQDFDLADPASVRAFTARWSGPLHGLVANAGIMALPELRRAGNGWELQLATNFLGHWALVTGLLGALTADARVAVVSSGAHQMAGVDFADPQFERRAYDPWLAYGQSKTAGVLLATALTTRGVTANALEPGRIHTALQRHLTASAMRELGAMDDDGNLLHPDGYKTPEQGAAASVLLVASPLVAGVSGRYIDEDMQPAAVTEGVAAWAVDPDAAERLWKLAGAAVEND